MNHSYLDSVITLVGGLRSFVELQGDMLAHTPEEIADNKDEITSRSATSRTMLIAGVNARESECFHLIVYPFMRF